MLAVRTVPVVAVVIAVGAVGGAAGPVESMGADRAGKPIAGTSCPEFPADNWWHADVRDLPAHRRSAQWLSHMSTDRDLHPDFGPSYGDGPDYGMPITVVGSGHRKVRVRFGYASESDRVRYPFGRDTKIEGGRNSAGDKHAIVVDRGTCRLYETWNTRVHDNRWRAGSGATSCPRSTAVALAHPLSARTSRPAVRERMPRR